MAFRNPAELRAEFAAHIDERVKTFRPPQPQGRRITSFNVHFWHDFNFIFGYKAIMDVVEESCSDVLLLQEMCEFSDGNLARIIEDFAALGFKHYVFSDMLGPESKYGPFGNAVFSRFPLVNAQIFFFTTQCSADLIPARFDKVHDLAYRNMAYATVMFPEGRLDVYSAHLDVFDESLEVRVAQYGEMFALANKRLVGTKSKGAIICGDMNNSIAEFSEKKFVIAKNSMSPCCGAELTKLSRASYGPEWEEDEYPFRCEDCLQIFNLFWNQENPTELKDRISAAHGKFKLATPEEISVWTMKTVDYGYVSPGVTVLKSHIIPTGVSDHFPVVLDVKI